MLSAGNPLDFSVQLLTWVLEGLRVAGQLCAGLGLTLATIAIGGVLRLVFETRPNWCGGPSDDAAAATKER